MLRRIGGPFEELVMTANDDYERLIGPIEDRMIHSIWRIVGDPADAEDAFQDALTSIWRRLEHVRSHPNPPALVLRICANAAYDILRRRRRRQRDSMLPGSPGDRSASVQEEVMQAERRLEIRQAIAQLSRNQAVAVLMRDVEDEPYEAIAQALGCGEATARKHVARARARLRVALSHLLDGSPEGGE